MKQLISIVLILLLGAQCLVQLGLVASYQLHKTYIVSSFCENKDKPEMHCEGKCFLKKRLAEAEKNERQASGIEKQLEIPSFLIVVAQQIAVRSFALVKGNISLTVHYMHIIYFNIFHPPSAVFL
ncbi:hypothetical protein [Pedobacter nyackensis]|uniref:hypothetical protein n=1 Tax=Pedobacter nyackensis TaxID=475255 RepID=UPI00292D1342|nr:hypothetical protein [Pedobacter nyackensis]